MAQHTISGSYSLFIDTGIHNLPATWADKAPQSRRRLLAAQFVDSLYAKSALASRCPLSLCL